MKVIKRLIKGAINVFKEIFLFTRDYILDWPDSTPLPEDPADRARIQAGLLGCTNPKALGKVEVIYRRKK